MSSQKVPRWALSAIREVHSNLHLLNELLHLSMAGLARARVGPKIVEFLAKIDREESDVDPVTQERELHRAQREAKLAQQELDNGFPLLHQQAVVTLWAYLEAAVRQLTTDFLQNEPSLIQTKPIFSKIRVSIATYESLSSNERYSYLADLLEREAASSIRYGPDRFERVLEEVGLGGDTPPELRRDLLELAQVRNVLIHRAGRIDRNLMDACPWLSYEPGQELEVSHELFAEYFNAAHFYLVAVTRRILERFEVNPDPELPALREYERSLGRS